MRNCIGFPYVCPPRGPCCRNCSHRSFICEEDGLMSSAFCFVFIDRDTIRKSNWVPSRSAGNPQPSAFKLHKLISGGLETYKLLLVCRCVSASRSLHRRREMVRQVWKHVLSTKSILVIKNVRIWRILFCAKKKKRILSPKFGVT